jgi:hypothetical protein
MWMEDNIKTNLKIIYDWVYWIHLAQMRVQLWSVSNMSERLTACQGCLLLVEGVTKPHGNFDEYNIRV